ncbi:hypothetical protein Tco_1511896, partial [Tanacetum coccineum]
RRDHSIHRRQLLTNFVEKFLGTVKFGNDQIAPILGYGDLERITEKRTKNEAKTTKPDSEWKSRKKTKSKSKPKPEKVNRKSTQVNPEAKSQEK